MRLIPIELSDIPRMTKGDRRNKREYERKLKSQGGAGSAHATEGENSPLQKLWALSLTKDIGALF